MMLILRYSHLLKSQKITVGFSIQNLKKLNQNKNEMPIQTDIEFFEAVDDLRFFQKQVYDYKWKSYETKLKEIEKQIDDYIYEQNMSSNREENDDREGGRQSIIPISSNRQ